MSPDEKDQRIEPKLLQSQVSKPTSQLAKFLFHITTYPWSSLVEGDEQPDWNNEWNDAIHVLHNFIGYVITTTAYHLGR